ncbi:MAG TPA: hypothetical protein VGM90_34490 [Kofleriaceae bacterium]|jgi:hypothetical protein
MKRALGLIALAACGAPGRAPASAPPSAPPPVSGIIAPKALPGLRWLTPHLPWRTPVEVSRIFEVPGAPNRAVLVGAGMWIGVVDLSTGLFTTERRIEHGRQAVQLLDGRIVVFSVVQGQNRGAFVDPATLAITSEHDLGDATDTTLDAIVAPGGELIASLPGQPLDVLDPTTLAVTRELSPATGLFGLTASLDAITVEHHDGTGYVHEEIALHPGGTIPWGQDVLVARGDTAVFGRNGGSYDDFAVKAGRVVKFGERVSRGALDATADRLATLDEGVVKIRTLKDGSVDRSIDIHDPDAGGYGDAIAFVGDRVVLTFHDQIRVVDLATKTTSIAPVGPLGRIKQVSVDNQGHVESLGHDRVQYADGRATASTVLDGYVFELRGGGAGTYALAKEDPLVSIKPPDYRRKGWLTWFVDGTQKMKIPTDTNTMIDGWSGRDALVLMGTPGGYSESGAFLRYDHDPEPHVRTSWNGNVGWLDLYPDFRPSAIDPDSRTAIVMYTTGPHVVDLTTGTPRKTTLQRPSCDPGIEMEHGGSRIALFDVSSIVLVDRETETVTASIDVSRLNANAHGISLHFLRGRDEVMLRADEQIAFWSPATKQLRVARMTGVDALDTSPDGHQLAIAFADARVALVDVDAFFARLPVEPARPFDVVPVACPPKH